MSQHEVVLLLGSNLGDTEKNLEDAIQLIEKSAGTILTKSKVLITQPIEFCSFNIFRNIALLINTQFSPLKLLKLVKQIERNLGRVQDSSFTGGYQDRIIDIDIVTYGRLNFNSKKLVVPHRKHLYDRDFSKELIKELTQKI